MTPQEVLNYYGSRRQFNKKTGISRSTLALWIKKGFVTYGNQCLLEKITGGALKAEKPDN